MVRPIVNLLHSKVHICLGPIVRTAPNELSFNTAQSWKDIYDFRQGHLTFIKSEFYDGGSFADRCGSIVSERDPQVHGIMRKYLSHAFSARSLTEQESLIAKSVDAFIRRIGEDGAKDIDIVMAFTLMSFDIIGDLGFGETFQGIESSRIYLLGWQNQSDSATCDRRCPPLDSSNDRCYDARRNSRLFQAFSDNRQNCLDVLRRPHQTHYPRHKNQRTILD